MAEAKQQEEPDVIAYKDPVMLSEIRSMAIENGCDPDSEVWDERKGMCVPIVGQPTEQ